MRNEAIAMLYESIKDRAPFSLDEFYKCLEGWDVIPLFNSKKIIGAVIQKDNELHVGYANKSKAYIRDHLKILSKVIREHGYCVTSVLKNNPQGLNFCKKLGFFEIAEESDKILLRCNRSRYVS
jgi:hypothetical protein